MLFRYTVKELIDGYLGWAASFKGGYTAGQSNGMVTYGVSGIWMRDAFQGFVGRKLRPSRLSGTLS